MIEKIILSSLKRHAKRQNANKISDISIGIKLNEETKKPIFILLKKGQIVYFVFKKTQEETPYTPVSELLGLMDFAKYETFGADKILSKKVVEIATENGITDLTEIFILISYNESKENLKLSLFKGNNFIKELDFEVLTD